MYTVLKWNANFLSITTILKLSLHVTVCSVLLAMDGLTKIERKVSSDKDTNGSSVRTFTPAELKLYNEPHNAHVAYRGKVSGVIT